MLMVARHIEHAIKDLEMSSKEVLKECRLQWTAFLDVHNSKEVRKRC